MGAVTDIVTWNLVGQDKKLILPTFSSESHVPVSSYDCSCRKLNNALSELINKQKMVARKKYYRPGNNIAQFCELKTKTSPETTKNKERYYTHRFGRPKIHSGLV
jgi:hypothetical protein